MSLELLFLGTGTSAGVPMIGCKCDVCRSTDPRDHRTRPSVLIRYPDPDPPGLLDPPGPRNRDRSDNHHADDTPQTRQWLIDTAPEMRTQMIRHQIDRLDGVFFTHSHADHVFGLDDLRRFNAVMKSPLDIYTEPATLDRIRSMFYYIFEPHKNVNKSFIATLIPSEIHPGDPMTLSGARWTPLRLMHGQLPILGFRVDYPVSRDGRSERSLNESEMFQTPDQSEYPSGKLPGGAGNSGGPGGTRLRSRSQGSLAYCTDVSGIPPETYPLLEDLDILVIDALRYRHHPTHLTVDQALEIIERVRPRRAYLTHIAHDILHADLEARLPEHVFLAFDGLALSCG